MSIVLMYSSELDDYFSFSTGGCRYICNWLNSTNMKIKIVSPLGVGVIYWYVKVDTLLADIRYFVFGEICNS